MAKFTIVFEQQMQEIAEVEYEASTADEARAEAQQDYDDGDDDLDWSDGKGSTTPEIVEVREGDKIVWSIDQAEPQLELPTMLVLSTAHITRATNSMFEMQTDDMPQFYAKGDDGWLIPIVGDEPFPHTCPDDLRAICELATRHGATWIMLDRDAATTDLLPTYEW